MTSFGKEFLARQHFMNLGEETLFNPYPFFRQLRNEKPVFQEPDYGVFLISKYDTIEDVCARTDEFSSLGAISGPFQPLPVELDARDAYRKTDEAEKLFTSDPPAHGKFRGVVARLLTAQRVKSLTPAIEAHANALIDAVADKGRVEFVREIARKLPALVVGSLMGIPDEVNDRFIRIMDETFEDMDQVFYGNPKSAVVGIHHALSDATAVYFREELAKRRKNPLGDPLSLFANATFDDGSEIPLEEMVRLCVFTYGGGAEANTPEMVATGGQMLADHPEIAASLRVDSSLMDRFVDEVLRYEAPALGLFRHATRDTEVEGVKIPKDSVLMLLYASANHDEQHFSDSEEFVMDRPRKRILSFGSGVHTCPGASLARLEAKIMFNALVARLDNIRRANPGDVLRYLPSCILRCPRELNLTFDVRPVN